MFRSKSLTRAKQAVVLAFVALAIVVVHAQKNPEQKAIDIQKGREKRVKARGEQVHYANKFDLSDLPKYTPEHQITGTVRIWGLNYLTDGNLAQYWEEGFKKYQPGVTFTWFTPTALVAVPGLYTGQADLGASRHITFDELLTFQRIYSYFPVEISMVTGSYDVPGWAPADTSVANKENPLSTLTSKQLD